MLKEKVMNSVSEILKEGNLLISQLEQFPLSSVRQVEMVCDRLKEKAGLSKRGSFSTESSPYPSSNKPISKSDITKVFSNDNFNAYIFTVNLYLYSNWRHLSQPVKHSSSLTLI